MFAPPLNYTLHYIYIWIELKVVRRPPDADWSAFPAGWGPDTMRDASKLVLGRIAGTDTPSQDGKIYFPEAFDVLGSLARSLGMREIKANEEPNGRNWTYSRVPFMV